MAGNASSALINQRCGATLKLVGLGIRIMSRRPLIFDGGKLFSCIFIFQARGCRAQPYPLLSATVSPLESNLNPPIHHYRRPGSAVMPFPAHFHFLDPTCRELYFVVRKHHRRIAIIRPAAIMPRDPSISWGFRMERGPGTYESYVGSTESLAFIIVGPPGSISSYSIDIPARGRKR